MFAIQTLSSDKLTIQIIVLEWKKPGQFVGKSAGLMIKRLWVRIPAGVVGKFFSSELTLCADSYSVSVPLLLLQWHVKELSHCGKGAGGRLHVNTHTPLT